MWSLTTGARWAGPRSHAADLLGFSHTTTVSGDNSERCQRKIQLQHLREPVFTTEVSRKASRTAQRVKAQGRWGFYSRRSCRVPLLSARNRNLRPRGGTGSPEVDSWRLENVALSERSRFLPGHADGRVRIWHQQHDYMNWTCLVSTVQSAGHCGVIVGGGGGDVFLANFESLNTNQSPFVTAYLRVAADRVNLFMASLPLSNCTSVASSPVWTDKTAFVMWRLAEWMCSWRICRNNEIQSCLHASGSHPVESIEVVSRAKRGWTQFYYVAANKVLGECINRNLQNEISSCCVTFFVCVHDSLLKNKRHTSINSRLNLVRLNKTTNVFAISWRQ